jgi:hypothetical protein
MAVKMGSWLFALSGYARFSLQVLPTYNPKRFKTNPTTKSRDQKHKERTEWNYGVVTGLYVVVEWLMLLLRILGVPGSNFDPEISHLHWGCSWFSSVPLAKWGDITLKLRHNRFLLHPFQFVLHLSPYHSTLYSLVWVTEKATKNNIQINQIDTRLCRSWIKRISLAKTKMTTRYSIVSTTY